mgnify:CR=1 FL=1
MLPHGAMLPSARVRCTLFFSGLVLRARSGGGQREALSTACFLLDTFIDSVARRAAPGPAHSAAIPIGRDPYVSVSKRH